LDHNNAIDPFKFAFKIFRCYTITIHTQKDFISIQGSNKATHCILYHPSLPDSEGVNVSL